MIKKSSAAAEVGFMY